MRTLLTLSFCWLIAVSGIKAQKLDHRLGYMLVQIEKEASIGDILSKNSSRIQGELLPDRIISQRLGIHLIRFDHSRVHEGKLLQQLREDKHVRVAQYDHLPTLRVVPDDPLFSDQWQWLNSGQTGGLLDADIDADEAWEITQGGLTASGDTIVVAVVDDGLDYNHEDIAANAWINHHEIDGNGVDDDGNGYIDDIHGWNAYADNPEVWGQNHGLNVSGMIGAVGNNAIGITGINWNVKIMIIRGGSPESTAIAAYAYALEQRILYNESNGERGAFVVSTNSSWGIDFGQPADAPLWCAFYDTLGSHGILSAAATANLNIDIDITSDLPTGCPSEYLLSVTALNHTNERTFSAYGLTQVDFGAPGEDIFTTRSNDDYGTTSGTSFASPVAAGLVALLYSAPCPRFAEFIHAIPSAAAQYIRDIMFMGVEPIPGMESTIRFGGSLNAGNSMEIMMALCADCPIPFGVEVDVISDTEVEVNWSMIDTVDAVNARYKPLFSNTWDTLFDVSQPLHLSNLLGCTEYEIEFETICADTSNGFQANTTFKTNGCCELPGEIIALSEETSIDISWNSVLAAELYLLSWRPEGTSNWIEEATAETHFIIEDLDRCTYYEFRLQTDCDTAASGFSDTLVIRTKGCGNCIDLLYCENIAGDASEEHIDSLVIGPLINHSGQNGGYQLFENPNPVYEVGELYDVWIRPGFGTGTTFNENFRIWLDANQDGVFDDSTELLLDSILSDNDTFMISQIAIPESALAGSTRMRVSMAFSNPFFPVPQEQCGDIDFGEVEDYCVQIVRNPEPCPEVGSLSFDAITFTSAFMFWPNAEGAIAYTYRWREVGTIDYKELATLDTTANLTDLEKCKMYEVQIRTVCTSDTTSYDTNYILETDCGVAVEDIKPLLSSFYLYPNPTHDFISMRLGTQESGNHNISIYNIQGQRLMSRVQFAESNTMLEVRMAELDVLTPGLYFVMVEKDGKTATQKFVKL